MKQKFTLILIVIIFSMLLPIKSYAREGLSAAKYTDDEKVFWYVKEDGRYLENQWKQVVDDWYYFGENGKSLHNQWFQDSDGKWYYFDEESIMLHDTTTPDGYYVGSDGAWVTE